MKHDTSPSQSSGVFKKFRSKVYVENGGRRLEKKITEGERMNAKETRLAEGRRGTTASLSRKNLYSIMQAVKKEAIAVCLDMTINRSSRRDYKRKESRY